MLSTLVLLTILLRLCQGGRQLDAEVLFPYDDYTTVHSEGYGIHGASLYTYFGTTGYNLGDINGDGLDDIIFGEYEYDEIGRAVVVFGSDTDSRASMTADTAAATPKGFQIVSTIYGPSMGSSFAAGDYNKDGNTDIVIGSSVTGNFGFTVLIWGREDNTWSDITVSHDMDASVGVVFTGGNSGDNFGLHVTHLGDFNNDTYDDFAVSGYAATEGSNTGVGKVYIVLGGESLPYGVLNDTNCLELTGAISFAHLGSALSTGDFNNDSIPDLIVSAYAASVPDYATGRVYVILGDSSFEIGAVNLGELAIGDTAGMYIDGDIENREFGSALDGRCDINGDGFDDVIIGTTSSSLTVPGIAMVLLGRASGFEGLELTSLDPADGFVITGGDVSKADAFGGGVGCLGFVNDDMYADYYVSHLDQDNNYAVTVFYGQAANSDTTLQNQQSNSNEVTNVHIAFEGGNHLGMGNSSLVFTNPDARSFSGSAFVFEDFTSNFGTESPTLSPTVSPSMTPTSFPTANPTMSPTASPTLSPTMTPTGGPTISPSMSPTSPTNSPSTSPSSWPTLSPSVSPTSTPTSIPTVAPTNFPTYTPTSSPTLSQCDISISTTGGDGLSWDLTDHEGDEEIASGDFGGEAMDFTLLASEEYLLFLSSDTVPAGTSITVTVNGQDTVIPLEQGLTTSTEIAGVSCDAISNKIAALDSAYSTATTTALLGMLMMFT